MDHAVTNGLLGMAGACIAFLSAAGCGENDASGGAAGTSVSPTGTSRTDTSAVVGEKLDAGYAKLDDGRAASGEEAGVLSSSRDGSASAPPEGGRPGCEGHEVELENGAVTGLTECLESGLVIRSGGSECVNDVPEFDLGQIPSRWLEELDDSFIRCESNADCNEQARGYCALVTTSQVPLTACRYACDTDADCGDGAVCDCGEDVGVCVPAECAMAADCEEGPCIRFDESSLCYDGYIGGGVYYACQGVDDECAVDQDCGEGEVCSSGSLLGSPLGYRKCQEARLCGI